MVTKSTKSKPAPPTTGSSLTALTASDVNKVISQLDLELALESQRKVFTAFSANNGSNDVQVPHRSTLTTSTQSTLVMPSRAGELLGCKFVGVPNEGSDGLSGTTVVMDSETGKVKGLVNARKLTALRNACGECRACPSGADRSLIAGSALSLRAVPPKREPRNLLIFGSGAQAYAHATVFLRLFSTLESCTFIVRQPSPRSEALLSDLSSSFPKIKLTIGSSEDASFNLTQAVHNANVILTLVPTTTPLFNSVDVTSGTHLVLVGSYKPEMRDVDDELIRRGGNILVDSKEACLKEAGEIISAGLQSDDMVELGTILGEKEGDRRTAGDVTIFKSVSRFSTCPASVHRRRHRAKLWI